MKPTDYVLDHLDNVTEDGKATCPACGNHSLVVTEGHNGQAVPRCREGCSRPVVLNAVGLSDADLYPPSGDGAAREHSAAPPEPPENGRLDEAGSEPAPEDFEEKSDDETPVDPSDYDNFAEFKHEDPKGYMKYLSEKRREADMALNSVPGHAGDESEASVKETATSAKPQRGYEWQPFPVEALPGPAAGYVRASAAAVGCSEAMVALPVLSALSAAVGSAARLQLKRSWREPATVWTMLVGLSGSAKTPAMKQSLRPIYRREREAKEEFERAFAEWKENEDVGENDKPERTRYRTGDATPEGTMKLLGENPRGLLLARNELGAWLGSFDRYAQGAADLQFWIEVWDGIQASRDRAGDGNVTVDSPAVPITGTIQPGALKEKLTPVHMESGFVARFVLANPPAEPLAWTEADVTEDTEADFEDLLSRLYGLPTGTELVLDAEAKRERKRFYNTANKEAHDFEDGPARAVAMKAIRYGARLALLVHLGRRAAGETTSDKVDAESMGHGLRLARWMRRETLRVYETLDVVTEARPPMLRFLDALPRTFKTSHAQAVADGRKIPERTCSNWLRRLTERGDLDKPRRGFYRKT